MPFIDMKPKRELVLRPEILLDPHIPKPLHGLNPRTLLGEDWWNEQRFKAYRHYDFHCWACGVISTQDEFESPLEAHERYEYDFKKHTARMTEVVAVCKPCHMFVHSGRTLMIYTAGEITFETLHMVITRGLKVLKDNRLGTNPYALAVYAEAYKIARILKHHVPDAPRALRVLYEGKRHPLPTEHLQASGLLVWNKWRLTIDGKEYKPLHRNIAEWRDYYG